VIFETVVVLAGLIMLLVLALAVKLKQG